MRFLDETVKDKRAGQKFRPPPTLKLVKSAAAVTPAGQRVEVLPALHLRGVGASSPGLHIRSGEIQETNDGFKLCVAGSEIEVYPFDERDPATKGDSAPLLWFANHLRENGLQWQAERERVRKLITRSIKEHAADMKAQKAAEEA